jgi:hypothetical protein
MMRALLALLLLSSAALADETITDAELCPVSLAESFAEVARLKAEIEVLRLRLRHQMADEDQVDPKTRVIKRAPKPEAKPKAK